MIVIYKKCHHNVLDPIRLPVWEKIRRQTRASGSKLEFSLSNYVFSLYSRNWRERRKEGIVKQRVSSATSKLKSQHTGLASVLTTMENPKFKQNAAPSETAPDHRFWHRRVSDLCIMNVSSNYMQVEKCLVEGSFQIKAHSAHAQSDYLFY